MDVLGQRNKGLVGSAGQELRGVEGGELGNAVSGDAACSRVVVRIVIGFDLHTRPQHRLQA
jgi:hypothetical protein